MRLRSILLIITLLLFAREKGYSQLGISHEIGVLAGPASVFTDYGERYDIENNLSNAGLGIGLIHYMNFAYKAECSCYTIDNYFNDHFKIRTEIDYFVSDLEHYGPVAEKNNTGGKLLRAMHGHTSTFEIGSALEYYPLSIRDFTAYAYWFSPFITLGAHFVSYHPKAYSDFGPITDDINLFPTFRNGGVNLESGTTFTVVASGGARYRLGPSSDLAVEGRWQYYNKDWIDGLNIEAPQNKANDWIFWVNVGYIYYLDFKK